MNVLSMFDLKGEKAIEAGVDIIDTAIRQRQRCYQRFHSGYW